MKPYPMTHIQHSWYDNIDYASILTNNGFDNKQLQYEFEVMEGSFNVRSRLLQRW